MKGQYSVEYLMIIGLALFVFGLALMFAFTQSSDLTSEAGVDQVITVGNLILETSEFIYSAGVGTFDTISFTLPVTVTNMSINNNRDLVFSVRSQRGETDLLFFSRRDLYFGNCTTVEPPDDLLDYISTPGRKELVLRKCGTNISIWHE
ncbi:MAG: hypothetical protein ACMXYF_04195 [Candidatus Woesearchaeota archaeon]